MPLASTLVDATFSGGLDTKTDELLVDPPALLEAQNVVFTDGGSLVKRNGFQPLSVNVLGGGTVVNGRALGTFQGELLQIADTGALYSYSTSQNAWMSRGTSSPLVIADTAVIRNSYTQSNPAGDTAGGVTVFAWEDTRGGVRASVIDEATGAVLLPDQSISATGSAPRVVAVGTTLVVLYADASALYMRTLNTLSPTAFATAILLDSSMPASGCRIDADAYDSNACIAAWNFSGQTRVAFVVPAAGSVGHPPNGYADPVNIAMGCSSAVSVTYDGTRIWTTGASASGYYGTVLTQALATSSGPTVIDASVSVVNATCSVSGTTLTAYYQISAAATYNHYLNYNTLTSAGVAGTAAIGMRSLGLASKYFTYGGRGYVLAVFSSTLQPTVFLLDVTVSAGTSYTWNVVGKGQPQLSGGLATLGMVPKVFSPSAGKFSTGALTRVQVTNQATATDGTVTTYTSFFLVGIDRLDFTFASATSFNSVEAGGNLLLAGGVLNMYDGQSVVEHGFHLFPENVSAVASASGGSMADGTYGIQVVWYWQDAQGQIHRSRPSLVVQATITGGGGAGSIALTIPTLRVTSKTGTRTAPIAAVFRTSSGGTLYQRVGNAAGDPVTAPVYSTNTADTVAFSLTVADATIAANEIIYTTGGRLPNEAPGACSQIATSMARVWLAGIVGQPVTAAYSQRIVPGVPVEFASTLYMVTDPRGREITGLGVIDEKAILFKQAAIYAVAGDGPDSTGNNNLFTEPGLVTSDVGTVVPESVAITPVGLIFQTSKGKYLLDRGLAVSYIGDAVEGYNSLTCTGGVTSDGTNQVRFTASDGVALVFDYFFKQWTTFANRYGSAPTFAAYDAVNWPRTANGPDVYVYLSTGGQVYYETPGAYVDTNNPVAMSLRTAWIKLKNLQGFVKIPWVTVLGRFFSNHVLRVGVAYDFKAVTAETHSFTPAQGSSPYGSGTYGAETPYGGAGDPVYQFRFRPDTMKCEAIQFSFTEQSPSNGAGFALSGLTLQAAVAGVPTKRLPAGQTIAST